MVNSRDKISSKTIYQKPVEYPPVVMAHMTEDISELFKYKMKDKKRLI